MSFPWSNHLIRFYMPRLQYFIRWWNPAAEWQSADRCHRIGQRRPCVITRLCIEDSVESRIVLLQEKKANLINGTINKDQGEALEKLTPEDMQFLFRGS